MLRYYAKDAEYSRSWFNQILGKKFSSKNEMAVFVGVSTRTVNDWQRAKYGIPELVFEKLKHIVECQNEDFLKRDDVELKRIAARKGGLVTGKKGLIIGDLESRRKGGYASLATHKLKKTGFFLLKDCKQIDHTIESAELTAIVIGDGHLSPGQIQITLDAKERDYAQYVQKLFKIVTGYDASLYNRAKTILTVSLSGRKISQEFNRLGVEYGNKTRSQSYIPNWIIGNKDFSKAFIKGIFDTDGCLYADKHVINKISYKYLGVALSASNPDFLSQIGNLLIDLGFDPTIGTRIQVRLRNQSDVQAFVAMIKPVNQKHLGQFKMEV